MKLIFVGAVAVFVMPRCASAQGQAEVFSGKDHESQLATLVQKAKTSGSSGAKLGDYQSHTISLSVRTSSGGAEVHAHYDDIFVVTEGKATLVPAERSSMGKPTRTAKLGGQAF